MGYFPNYTAQFFLKKSSWGKSYFLAPLKQTTVERAFGFRAYILEHSHHSLNKQYLGGPIDAVLLEKSVSSTIPSFCAAPGWILTWAMCII